MRKRGISKCFSTPFPAPSWPPSSRYAVHLKEPRPDADAEYVDDVLLISGDRSETRPFSGLIQGGLLAGLLAGLYLSSLYNYLLFHSLVEIFSIIIACTLFLITWNSRAYIRNPYLLFIGTAYLFIAGLDLLHTLSYKGMRIFTDYEYYANQLWIAARYMEAFTLLLGFAFLRRNRMVDVRLVFAAYLAVSTLAVLSVFVWKIFPECFVEGQGLTPFKKNSEYVISGILVLCIGMVRRNRDRFEKNVYRWIVLSILSTIVSELAFTFYVSNYGISNLIGHYFKIFSFLLIYKAIIETGITRPFAMIFRELTDSNERLAAEIKTRRRAEQEKEKVIMNLEQALSDVKTLSGLLPICASCKKIRDDRGYWNKIEAYVSERTHASFSHGICPDCMKSLYPDFDIEG